MLGEGWLRMHEHSVSEVLHGPTASKSPPSTPRSSAFAASWFVTRIYMFPAYVIRSTLIEAAVRW